METFFIGYKYLIRLCTTFFLHAYLIFLVLAQRGYFKDTTFINYLKYLLYWKEPEYAKYLRYPMCLYFLDLLQYEHFRREVVNSQCTKFIDDQQILLWQHYTRRRTRLLQTAAEQTQHVNPHNNGIVQPKVPWKRAMSGNKKTEQYTF